MRKPFLWLLIISFLASTLPLPAQTPQAPTPAKAPLPTVAVLPFDIGPGVDPNARMMLTDELQTTLFKSGKWNLINEAERDKVLRQHSFNQSGCTSSECAVQAGRILQVQKIITGSVNYYGGIFKITIKLTDVETESVERIVDDNCRECKPEDLLQVVQRLAFQLSGGGPEVVLPQGVTPPSQPAGKGKIEIITDPPNAQIYLDSTIAGTTNKVLENIPAGKHKLVIVLEGYENISKMIIVEPNQIAKVKEIFVPQTGALEVTSDPTGAMIYLNGKYVGKTPYKLPEIRVGSYSIKIELNDYQTVEQKIAISYQQLNKLNFPLKGLPGKILVTSTPPGATVYIDGKKYGSTPLSGIELEPGTHGVLVKLEGYQALEKKIQIAPNSPAELDFALILNAPEVAGKHKKPEKSKAESEKKPWYKKKWVWALLIVAIGGGVAAAGMGSGNGGSGGNGGSSTPPTTGSVTATGTPTFP